MVICSRCGGRADVDDDGEPTKPLSDGKGGYFCMFCCELVKELEEERKMERAPWMLKRDRLIGQTAVGDCFVSTVQLPFEHYGYTYETLVYPAEKYGQIRRYKTREEAERGHKEVVAEMEALLSVSLVPVAH